MAQWIARWTVVRDPAGSNPQRVCQSALQVVGSVVGVRTAEGRARGVGGRAGGEGGRDESAKLGFRQKCKIF